MADDFKKDSPYNITARFESFYAVKKPKPPTNIELYFDFYYLVGSMSILPYGINKLSFGQGTSAKNNLTYVYVQPISQCVFGEIAIRNQSLFIAPAGITSDARYGNALVENDSKDIYPVAISSLETGQSLIYNLKQFLKPTTPYNQSSYGTAYLQGGVKYVMPAGREQTAFGVILATNTTADQKIAPNGIYQFAMLEPTVSPRIVYAIGFRSLDMGMPDMRDPAIKPNGLVHSSYGKPTIWYHTRPLAPTGIMSFESGYPIVADPAQFVQPPSLLTSAVFGDIAIRNLSLGVFAQSIVSSEFSDYSTLTNSNRYYQPQGIDSQDIGNQSIENKTPSIFVGGIEPFETALPAISYKIRLVQPTGFDRLLLGVPELTTSPELAVDGIDGLGIDEPAISHKIRFIETVEIDSAEYGEATVWYVYRPIAPESWESSEFGEQDISHGLREVIADGYCDDSYGEPWVTYGSRSIEPNSIYEDFASSHLVGFNQEIKPLGYVATLFGERIIPISQSLYPQGFSTLWGLHELSLYTRTIAPIGYVSASEQGADRWGRVTFYNLSQYVTQYYQGDSGLVPPTWSGYMLIENRVKAIGVVGFTSQKFGYSQIDNNAVPLPPLGIEPPPITIGMVSHGIRTLTVEAIEPPLVSSWGAVYNDGRVIAPQGSIHASFGEHSAINTRRYYRDWGRIDSLEMSEPAIGYAIRTIAIEPRYSIEPPQINLPTIDLYTRYVELRGYDAGRYGLPSLSIHFNIIGTSWVHREKIGYPALHNVTPTLYGYGHDSSEFGNTAIRTQWREVKAQGDNTALFGLVKISDTKQVIEVRGWHDTEYGQLNKVEQTGSNQYVVQHIRLNNIINNDSDGYGIWFDPDLHGQQLPAPVLSQNVIAPEWLGVSSSFGDALLWSNNIEVRGGIGIDGVSRELSIYNKIQSVSLNQQGIDNSIVFGKPRLSPHTIWAVSEAPAQAIENHDGVVGEAVGADQYHSTSLRMGEPTIESTIRAISPYGWHDSEETISEPSLSLSLIVVYPEPMNTLRVGMPSIPFTPQSINLIAGIDSNEWGSSEIDYGAYLGAQTIYFDGLDSFDSGDTSIDNLMRYLDALGDDSLEMGLPLDGDSPYMWQGLRVGERVPFVVGGDDMTLFGDTTISLRIREIPVTGFNAFRSGYDTSDFKGRMTVRNKDSGKPASQSVNVSGISQPSIGNNDIRWGQRFIRPDGNSDQFRKGGYHA